MGRTMMTGARRPEVAGAANRGPVSSSTTGGRVNIPNLLPPGTARFILTLLIGLVASATTLLAQAPEIYLGSDPDAPPTCNCLNNATNSVNGQFTDTVTVAAPTGQTWTVMTVSSAYADNSPAPPANPIPIVGGTPLVEVSTGIYQLIVRHRDATGFSMTVTNGVNMLTISNNCYYPNVTLTVPDTICLTSFPLDLTANVNGAVGVGQFFIDGVPSATFNAAALGEGTYLVSYTFDAGEGTPGDINDPACSYTVSKMVTVPPQPDLVTNDLLNLVLGPDCESVIVPDMILEGTYPCEDDFIITVYDQNGFPIGNTITGAQAGYTLDVLVTSEVGGYIGESQIQVFDITAPEITCPESDYLVEIPNEIQFLSGSITTANETFLPNNFSCYNSRVAPLSGLHYYRLDTFTVSEMDTYTIELDMNSLANGGVFALYHNEFNQFGGFCQNAVRFSTPAPGDTGY
ncbi:MAG: hypothetical protein KDC54_04240, partial [Lewinella sp.]|nr:hypothetical protein [Lewinella sp.]